MSNLSQEYKNEIQEIFGEIYAKYIKDELQAAVDSGITSRLKAATDGMSKQAGQTVRKEVELMSSELRKGITDSIKNELPEIIKATVPVPKEVKEVDYQRIGQIVMRTFGERKETEKIEAALKSHMLADAKSPGSGNKAVQRLLFGLLAVNILNILIVLLFLFR